MTNVLVYTPTIGNRLQGWQAKLALALVLLSALSFYSGKLLADDKQMAKPKQHHEHEAGNSAEEPGAGMSGGKHGSHTMMDDDLKLDDKQKEALKGAMKQMHESMRGGRETHEQIRDMVDSGNYDEKKVRELIRKENTERENNIVKSSKAMNDFMQSLSPEQKAKFIEKRKNMKKRMHDNMKDHMHGMKDGKDKQCDNDDDEFEPEEM